LTLDPSSDLQTNTVQMVWHIQGIGEFEAVSKLALEWDNFGALTGK
jgi:hypothetical protein